MNSVLEVAKQRALAIATNNPSGHPKDAEKGRACKRCGDTRRVLKVPTHPKAPVTTEKCPAC